MGKVKRPSVEGLSKKQYDQRFRAVGRQIDIAFNGDVPPEDKKTGIILITFPFGSESEELIYNYVSNCRGNDAMDLLLSIVAKETEKPTAK